MRPVRVAPFGVVQPWGRNVARQSTLVSEHPSIARAFAEVDRLSAEMVRTGASSDAVVLLVIDAEGQRMTRPRVQ